MQFQKAHTEGFPSSSDSTESACINTEGFPGCSDSTESACANTEVLHDQPDE